MDATTEMPNLPILMRMTPTERALGRFMRAPDHDAGDAGDADADAGDSGKAADATGNTPGEGAGSVTDGAGDGDASLVSQAAAKAGTGKDGEAGKGDASGADKDGDKDGAKSEGAPEAYELKLTVGEGDDASEVAMDPALVEAATPILKDLNLSNEAANKLTALVPQVQARMVQQQIDEFEKTSSDWAKEVKADKEIGGSNWGETEHLMAKALDAYGSPELIALIDESRIGNHIAFVRFVRSVGAARSEDGEFPRGNPTAEKVDSASLHYPEDAPKSA